MANRRFIDFPVATTVGANDIILIWQDGLNKQTTKATILSGLPEDLEDLADVNISGLTNGQILRYDSTTGKWENTDQGNLDLNDLNDVSIVSPSNGQVLVYNSSTSKWENSSGGFVPYTGAVTTVNLGAQTIQAGSFVKQGGTSAQFLKADGSVDSNAYLTTGSAAATYVPYTGATADVNLGTHDLTAERGTFENNGSSDTLTVNHTSGSGIGVKVTKGGNNEALLVTKTSGSGNAMAVVGGRTALVDLSLSSVSNATGNFLTISGGVVHQRTPSETRSDVGAQAQLNGTGFVKASGTTITYDNSTYQVTSEKAQPNGYASLDSNGKVPLVQINDALIGNVNFQGLWNAATNTPTLANPPASGTKGYYYIVSTAGTFAGISFEVGDWIISNGTAWGKVDNTDAVSSVFGRTGNVTATNGDYNTSQVTENTNLYYTEARVNANANVAANTAARHNAVTLGTANGLSLSTQVLSLQLATSGQNGALSSTDWTTFNNKENAITAGTTAQYFRGDKTFQTLNTGVVPESGNLYFTNARAIASVLTGYSSGAGTISAADSILSAIQKLNGNIGALVTGVSSVNGLTGVVVLTTTNIAEGTNLYYTEARVNANTNVAANTAARHAAVTLGTANGLSLSTQQLSLGLASAGVTGALSGTDWSTFNSKQQALNGTGFVKISGTTISYDNTNYLPLTGGTLTGALGGTSASFSGSVTTRNGTTIASLGQISVIGTGEFMSTGSLSGYFFENRAGGTVTSSSNWYGWYATSAIVRLFNGSTDILKINGSNGATTFESTITATSIIRTGGTSAQFLKADGSVDSNTYYLASNPSAFIALTALSGTAPIQYNNTTGAISITQASGSTNGFLSSTDWNTFNNKTSNVGTVTSVAALTLGTSGTDLSSSVANGTTTPVITLNVPTASAANRGALSAADWTTFNSKENAVTAGTTAQYYRGDKTFQTLNTAAVPESGNLYYTEARVNANANVAANTAARHNAVTLGTANGLSLSTQQLSLGLASSSANGALSSTDWTTFNNKQNALTNPVTGTGTTNYLPKFTGASTIGNSIITDSGSQVVINTATSTTSQFRIENTSFAAGQTMGIDFTVGGGSKQAYVRAVVNNGTTAATDLVFGTASGGNNAATVLTLASTGAATFSSSVTALRYIANAQATYGSLTYEETFKYASSPAGIWFGNSFNSNNNVGVQLRTSNDNTSVQALTLAPTGAATFSSSVQATIITATSYFSSDAYRDSRLQKLLGYEGGNQIRLGSGDSFDFLTFFAGASERMRIWASSGNVNIGPTPSSDAGFRLDVNGTGRFSGTLTAPVFTDGFITIGAAQINRTSATVEMQFAGSGDVRFFGNTAYPIRFASGTGAATFSSSVTAASPGNSANSIVGNYSGGSQMMQFFQKPDGSNMEFNLRNSSGTAIVRIDTSGNSWFNGGNVGIGTPSPATKLTIYSGGGSFISGTNDGVRLQVAGYNSLSRNTISWHQDSADLNLGRFGIEWNGSSGQMNFVWRDLYNNAAGTTELMRLQGNGNLLIGTTTDNSNRLRVNGSIWADGNILMDSSVNRFVGFGTGNSNAHISFLSTNTLSLNSSSGGLIQFNINGNQIGRFNSVEVFANSVLTSAPYGTTARSWKLGRYITETTSADGSIRVEIDGRYYNIAAQDLGVVPS